MPEETLTGTLLLSCPDQRGLVARIAQFIFTRGGNIIDLDEHVDTNEGLFFLRVSWNMTGFALSGDEVSNEFQPMAEEFQAQWTIKLSRTQDRRRLAIFVSKYDHCLQEILWRHELGEFQADISLIVSNHTDLKSLADLHHVPFHVFPINKENKLEQEQKELSLLKNENIDTVILARYMQVLSPTFVAEYPNNVVNIHHSFLPAFAGGNPYKQAYERGVKIIGATSHYVTDNLDEGPIIEQDIIRISHKDTLADLIRKGRDLERMVLARALRLHLQDRILVHGNKTVVFD
ncbi:MAG: formyltetrahydrofolate deformylase [Candidatus Methylumidiphilus alinenensis]|uniref:Formyltetrahydrofolate deformylase n=1 Tax=Candidatus Methylumidiphilus alinenensis TaxID=2202197 RepID=A0A2W4RZ84_9GAMM|nr:MAG: formyltetrahydrofolate deformylase [Candidatus Methylumidiphilus alinenensis]